MALDTAKATVTLRDLTQKFDNSVRSAMPFWPEICTPVQSTGLDEKYGLLGNVPGMREWIGDRQFKELRSGNFVVTNKHWEQSLRIKKTDLADDRMGLYGPLMEQLGAEASYHPDSELIDLLVAGESVACFDGQFFFDTDHVWGDSGTQDNDLTGAAATGTAPTAAEAKAAYHTCRTALVKFKNDQGKFLNRTTLRTNRDLMVLVPPDFEQAFREGLGSLLFGGGNTNVVLDAPEIVSSPLLTDADRFYVINKSAPLKPFVMQQREPISRQMKGLDDLETQDVKFMTESRWNVAYLAWWTAVLYTFT